PAAGSAGPRRGGDSHDRGVVGAPPPHPPAARDRDAARRGESPLSRARRRHRILRRGRPAWARSGRERLRRRAGPERDRASLAHPLAIPALGRRLRLAGDGRRGSGIGTGATSDNRTPTEEETRMKWISTLAAFVTCLVM